MTTPAKAQHAHVLRRMLRVRAELEITNRSLCERHGCEPDLLDAIWTGSVREGDLFERVKADLFDGGYGKEKGVNARASRPRKNPPVPAARRAAIGLLIKAGLRQRNMCYRVAAETVGIKSASNIWRACAGKKGCSGLQIQLCEVLGINMDSVPDAPALPVATVRPKVVPMVPAPTPEVTWDRRAIWLLKQAHAVERFAEAAKWYVDAIMPGAPMSAALLPEYAEELRRARELCEDAGVAVAECPLRDEGLLVA